MFERCPTNASKCWRSSDEGVDRKVLGEKEVEEFRGTSHRKGHYGRVLKSA